MPVALDVAVTLCIIIVAQQRVVVTRLGPIRGTTNYQIRTKLSRSSSSPKEKGRERKNILHNNHYAKSVPSSTAVNVG